MDRLTPEFVELVDQFCEGNLSAEQAGRLEALVGESDEWRQYLLELDRIPQSGQSSSVTSAVSRVCTAPLSVMGGGDRRRSSPR